MPRSIKTAVQGSHADTHQQPQNWRTLRQGKLNETYGSLDQVSLSLPPRVPRTREATAFVCVCLAVGKTHAAVRVRLRVRLRRRLRRRPRRWTASVPEEQCRGTVLREVARRFHALSVWRPCLAGFCERPAEGPWRRLPAPLEVAVGLSLLPAA